MGKGNFILKNALKYKDINFIGIEKFDTVIAKAIKKVKGGVRAVNAYGKKVTRERKENPTKASLIAEIADFLQKNSENAIENCEITNKERQIAFKIGENSFELTLVQKRKPKK